MVRRLLLYILCGKEGATVMAMLFAQAIMQGKKTFAQVPRLLKEQVREILIDSGCEFLATEGE